MALNFLKGFNWQNGNTVTPDRLNQMQEDLILQCATAVLLGRATAGTGEVEELTPAQARTLLGLVIGTDVQAADADLAAIAALTTTAYGRAFLVLADAAAGRTALGLGTAATQASSAFDPAGSAAAAQAAAIAASQPVDSDLTAIAALTTTAFGRSLLTLASANLGRVALNSGEVALTDAATIATDCATGNVFTVTLGGNRTMGAPTNLQAGATYIWKPKQDGTGGRTLSWNAVFKFPGGTAPVLTTTAAAVDIISGVSDGTSIFCSFIQDVK